jgi:hypothetical protein
MSMVWFAILALIAGFDGHSCRSDRESARLVSAQSDKGLNTGPSCSLSNGRGMVQRRCLAPWSACGVDEFDTEEQDETWMVHLDLLAAFPVDWLIWARIPTRSEPERIESLDPSFPAYSPLRC